MKVLKTALFSFQSVILLAFLFFSLILSAQDIIPIPADSTSEWRITRGYNDGICANYFNSIYYVDGIVTNNGVEYFRILETGSFHQSVIVPPGPCDDSYDYTGVYRGAIRTEAGKVYELSGNEEYLLMDFTQNVGDTLNTIIGSGLIIGSIDSVLIGEAYRKRFNFSNGDVCHWMIEGIGHEAGLFEPMFLALEQISEFICYGEDNIPLYGSLDCILNVGSNENVFVDSEFEIYPNPAVDWLYIKQSNPNYTYNVEVRNLYGQLVKEEMNIQSSHYALNLADLKAGVYFYLIKDENQIIQKGKVIIK